MIFREEHVGGRERMTTDEEQVPRGAEQKTVELRSVNAKATIQIRL